MSDFTSDFWAIYVGVITVVSILACAVLLYAYSTQRLNKGTQGDTTGHTWDENLSEWNNPLPRWWMWMFYITILFGLAYVVLYPGLGNYAGVLGWTSTGQFDDEQKQAAECVSRSGSLGSVRDGDAEQNAAVAKIGSLLFRDQYHGQRTTVVSDYESAAVAAWQIWFGRWAAHGTHWPCHAADLSLRKRCNSTAKAGRRSRIHTSGGSIAG